ncbi:MAG: ABC transporter permease, partial [Bacteroidota bacterium]
DLIELFGRDFSKSRFILNSIRFFRWRYLKNIDEFDNLTNLAMLKNYITTAFRALIKQKSYTAINILGLAIALASAMLISIYIRHESSFDDFHKDGNRIYRITKNARGRYTPPLLAHTIREEIPQFKAATKVYGTAEAVFNINNQFIKQDGAAWADQDFFKVFELPFLEGDPSTALSKPDNVVLTSSIATKYFPDESAMGKVLAIDGENYSVSGILEDLPRNTHFPFQYVIASHLDLTGRYYWTGGDGFTYAKLAKGSSLEAADRELEKLYTKYAGPEIITWSGHATYEEYKAEYSEYPHTYVSHSLADIHLEKSFLSIRNPGSKENIKIFFLTSLFIIIIACINYVNMSTAKSTVRSKEVGIRKTLGSDKVSVIFQFLTESLLLTCLAAIIAILLCLFTLDLFNTITLRDFNFADVFSLKNLLVYSFLVVLIGLLAGAYPAIVISRFSPIAALKGGIKLKGKSYFRNALVAFQFATSIFLITATLIIYLQEKHLKSIDTGLDIYKTLVIANTERLEDRYETFKRQLLSLPSVKQVAKASDVPFMGYPNYGYTEQGTKQVANPDNFFVEPGFEEILDIELVQGRFHKPRTLSDTSTVIINESFVKEMNWEEPLGKVLLREPQKFKVVGVMKDFNISSLKNEIGPTILRYGANVQDIQIWHQRNTLIKYSGENIQQLLSDVEAIWTSFIPDYPFEASFLDDNFNRLYEGERRFGQIFTIFSTLAIFIAFLGLVALTSFVLQKKYKEIAIRKVMGASVPAILRMIMREFSILVFLGGLIAIPSVFYWLQDWLSGYSNRLELDWYLLASPLIGILVLTMLLVSLRSFSAATQNPANALKDE